MTQATLPPPPAPPTQAPPTQAPPPAGGAGAGQPIAKATIASTPIDPPGQPTPIAVGGGSPAQTPPPATPPQTWPGNPPPTQPPAQASPPPTPPTQASPPPTTPPPPVPGAQQLHPIRKKIIELAQAEVGKVMDAGGGGGNKQGWERLQEYYETAYHRPLNAQELDLVRRNGQRLNHWCGIFANWALVKAGLTAAEWKIAQGIQNIPRGSGRDFQPGDVLVLAALSHHCILKSRSGDTLETIDGNQEFQGIRNRTRSAGDIVGWFKVTPEVYV